MSWSSISSSLTSSSSDLGSSSSYAKNGIYFIDNTLNSLLDKNVTPVGFRHFRVPSTNNVIMHHFIVLEVRPPGQHITSNTFIKFEKNQLRAGERPPTEGSGPLGIVTVYIFNEISLGKNHAKVHEVKLPQGCQEILMQELLNLLTTERTLSYSVWKNNCWKYVYDCERAMLCAFAALPNTSPECKESLDEARKNLPKPSLLSDVFHWSRLLASAIFGFVGSASIEGTRVVATLINIAVDAAKAARVKGLARASLYGVKHIRMILGRPGLTATKALLGLFSWKVLFISTGGLTFVINVLCLAVCIYQNTTLVKNFFHWILQSKVPAADELTTS